MIEHNQGDCKGLQTIARAAAIGVCAAILGLLLLTGYLLFDGPAHAAADHPTQQEIAACGHDAVRFCSVEIQMGTAAQCLVKNRKIISPACDRMLKEKGL
jgi:hypothetical protein